MFGNLFDESRIDSAVKEYAVEHKSSQPSSYSYSPFSVSGLFVIAVSGNAIVSEGLNEEFVREFCNKVSELHSQGFKIAIVAGSGAVAEDFKQLASTLNQNNFALDEIALQFSNANALLLIQGVSNSFPRVLSDFQDAIQALDSGRIPVFSGNCRQGLSVESFASLLAEFLGANLIVLSDSAGIQKKLKNGRLKTIESISYDKLLELALKPQDSEGFVFDAFAIQVLKRSGIKALIMQAQNLESLESAVRGSGFEGTIVE